MSNNGKSMNLSMFYLKDSSFESPNTPVIFAENINSPLIDVDVNVQFRTLNEEASQFESVLMIKIKAKTGETTMFLIEVLQAAHVEISGYSDSDKEKILNIAVPIALLPFARETVSSLVGKGCFPPLLLRQMNFEKYLSRKSSRQTRKSRLNQPSTRRCLYFPKSQSWVQVHSAPLWPSPWQAMKFR